MIDKQEHRSLPPEVTSLPTKNKSLVYKQYTNHMYHKERLQFWGRNSKGKFAYPEYPQSRPGYANSRLQLGMREYNLQRASKYGNLCFDCAAVLENAPIQQNVWDAVRVYGQDSAFIKVRFEGVGHEVGPFRSVRWGVRGDEARRFAIHKGSDRRDSATLGTSE